MTLTVDTPPTVFPLGRSASLTVTLTGPSPVHFVSIDLTSDGQPAWYYVLHDARGSLTYTVGPFKKNGRNELVVHAVDELGCEASNDVRLYVTVQ